MNVLLFGVLLTVIGGVGLADGRYLHAAAACVLWGLVWAASGAVLVAL